jgi:hypothetical protein
MEKDSGEGILPSAPLVAEVCVPVSPLSPCQFGQFAKLCSDKKKSSRRTRRSLLAITS